VTGEQTPEAVVPDEEPAAGSVQPLLSVTKGEPSAEELAALTAVVLSLGGEGAAETAKPTVRHWVRRQQLRLAPSPGPGAWKRSRG
jgi:Acyl-CoA carboxylase epsilon subunit